MFKMLRRKSTEAHLSNLQLALSSGMVDFQPFRRSLLDKAKTYSMIPSLENCTRNEASKAIFMKMLKTVSNMEAKTLNSFKHSCRDEMGFGKKLSLPEMRANIFFALFDQAELAMPKKLNPEDTSWLGTKNGLLFSDVVGAISQICAGIVNSRDMEEPYVY